MDPSKESESTPRFLMTLSFMHQNPWQQIISGPDGIVNEQLKMLPHEILEIIHKLFFIMWATRITPTSWKTSVAKLTNKN